MAYALTTLWYERNRYLPGVLAVTFSAVLIAVQAGLLLGLFSITSIPIDRARADLWVGSPDLVSMDVGGPIPRAWMDRIATQPGVVQTEVYLQGFSRWDKPNGGQELCDVIGTRLGPDSLGAIPELTPALRARLSEPGAVVVDAGELARLGIHGVGANAEIAGRHVRVVGLVHGLKSLVGPYVFCSVQTARERLPHLAGQDSTTYLLARTRTPEDAARAAQALSWRYPDLSAYTKSQFSFRTRMHWLLRTKAGIALGCAALLGLLVGAVVTSQTLYAATVASLRELAVLRALGIPRRRMVAWVVSLAFWVGLFGILIALPASGLLAQAAGVLGAKLLLPWWILGSAAGVTLVMALLSGLAALRSLRLAQPATLLR